MVDIDIKSKKVHALILYSAFSIFLISLIISVIDGLLVCIHLYAIYAIRQLRAYSFDIHLRIVYYYFLLFSWSCPQFAQHDSYFRRVSYGK